MTTLSARSIVHDYPGPLRAVDGVDLDLAPGELLCLLGPNGSGKSTLLKILAGVLRPTSGDVLLDDRPLANMRPRERAHRIASVPQVLLGLPETNVASFVLGGRYSHLGLLGRVHPEDRAAVRRALAETDAEEWSERNLGELSGGEHQRVLVARALAQEAALLIFDEPTASLDPEHQVLIFELISRLVRDGRSAVMATHELSLTSRYADRVVLLDHGRVAAMGTPAEVFRPEVLEPVYGPHLVFASAPGGGSSLVVPWPTGDRPPGE